MTFTEKLRLLAHRRGQSVRAIALQLEFDPSAPAQWKRRNKAPGPELTKRLADFFGVSVDVLLDPAEELPLDPRQEVHQVLEEAPTGVRNAFIQPTSAWAHYLLMEALFDRMLAERSGEKMTPAEQEDFRQSMRAFGRKRAKDRAALHEAVRLAEDIGTRVLSHHLATQARSKKYSAYGS